MPIAKETSRTRAVPNRPTPAFGNPDLPPEGRMNTRHNPESLRSDGPQNEVLESQFPSQKDPPATDISTQPFFWSSFNISPKRIQNGGWARELTPRTSRSPTRSPASTCTWRPAASANCIGTRPPSGRS